MYYNVGKIVNTHGIHGELRIVSITDFPEKRFKNGSHLAIFKNEFDPVPMQLITVKKARQNKGFTLLTFYDFYDINAVLPFKGTMLKVEDNQLINDNLDAGEYYYHQIIGLTVVDLTGNQIGTVKEIMAPGANDIWVVSRPGQSDLLLPVIKQVVKKVNLKNNQVIIELMEGLN